MAKTVLGLDLGPTSIGWALLEKENGQEKSIIGTGVRIFQEGVERSNKGEEISKNHQRQLARSARRIKQRRRMRKELLLKRCVKSGLLPENKNDLEKLLQSDPYFLRSKALDEEISLLELGRALFHLNQRRGFKSNRKSGKDSDSGKIQKGITELQSKIEETNSRTLGEFLRQIEASGREKEETNLTDLLLGEIRIRNRYTLRSMYEDEFEKIWESQTRFHPKTLTKELKEKIFDAIFFQRPLKPKDHLIGRCDLEPEEPRCPRADWAAQHFRILKEVNNLKIINRDGSEQELTDSQRETIVSLLTVSKQKNFSVIKKKLEMLDSQAFNLEKGGRDKLLGNTVDAKLSSVFGAKSWRKMEDADKDELRDRITDIEDPEELEAYLEDKWELKEKDIESLINVDLPSGYMNFSQKALKKIIPLLQEGKNEFDAISELYPDWQEIKLSHSEKLPKPPDVRNPIVQRALTEVRKVVNGIVRKHGRPDTIYVELARDVKGSMQNRKDESLKMWKRNQDNEEIKALLKSDYLKDPRMSDVVKYKLWREQEGICVYSGKAIPMEKLFTPDIEVDHILPYSRSLDDSYFNKVVCWVKANRDKGNRTPREWLEGNQGKWEKLKQRAHSFENMPRNKRNKFNQKEIMITKDKAGKIEVDTFIQRQLNDTRYISRQVAAYLQSLFPIEEQKKRKVVQATRGQLTAELRWQWGLNRILNPLNLDIKSREDHRHHAVDAIVIACSTAEHMRRLATIEKYKLERKPLPAPWENFRGDVANAVNEIIVSFRVQRKIAGALHKETNYGPISGDKFVYRVGLTSLTGAMVEKIRDKQIKRLVIERCNEKGVDPKKINAKVFPDDEPLRMKSGVIIKKVRIEKTIGKSRIAFQDKDGKVFRYAELGSNHHIEILRTKDKKGKVKYDGVVVSTLEATRRAKNKNPIIQKDHGPKKEFVFSLSINESVMIKLDDGKHHPFRVQKMDTSTLVVFRPNTYAGKVSNSDKWPKILRKYPNSLMEMDAFKVTISPVGEVSVVHD